MTGRVILLVLVSWIIGFMWFSVSLPQPVRCHFDRPFAESRFSGDLGNRIGAAGA